MEDISFFGQDKSGRLCCLPQDASDQLIAMASGTALKLDHQKNGWKGVSIYHEENGDAIMCPIWALVQRFIHIRTNGGTICFGSLCQQLYSNSHS